MEVKNAIISAGICKPDKENLSISLQISDGSRKNNAITKRYFVKLNNKFLCTVKCIPRNGVYKLEDVIKTQKLFSKFLHVTSPDIYGVYYGRDENVYIVEEYITNSLTLKDLIQRGEISSDEAADIVTNIYKDIISQPSQGFNEKILAEEMEEFLNAAKMLLIPDDYIELLKKKIKEKLNLIINPAKRTTRDLIPKNILLSKGKWVVVDYDLSRLTHFLWIDFYRTNFYSKNLFCINSEEYLPKRVDQALLELLFYLSEIYLQAQVLTNVELSFSPLFNNLQKNALKQFDRIFSTNFYTMDTFKLFNKEIPFKIDGKIIQDNNSANLQLFWKESTDFEEVNSIKIPLLQDGAMHRYDIELPSNVKGELRIDPGNNYAFIEISRIVLFSRDTNIGERWKPIIYYSSTNSFTGLEFGPGIILLENNKHLRLISLTDDPQLYLKNLPIRQKHENWCLRIEFSINNNIPHQAANEINSIKKNAEELEKQLEQSINDIDKLKNIINAMINSHSWRLTSPLRSLGKILKYGKRVFKRIPGILVFGNRDIHYKALNGVVFRNEYWEAINEDPQFIIVNSVLPVGKVEFHIDLTVSEPSLFQVFIDTGDGFREEQSIICPIKRKGRNTLSFTLQLGLNVSKIRFDPINTIGKIYIHNFYFRRICLPIISTLFKGCISEFHKYIYNIQSYYNRKRLVKAIKPLTDRRPIDIIIPVYNAYEDLVACVDSVLANTTIPYRLILIDDASPDPRIREYFDELEGRGLNNLIILRNTQNLGFVGTVNRGMKLAQGHVVLLNSDTEVPPRWLERLYSVVESDMTIGTVTPFSNNATICSFPDFCKDNLLPKGYNVNQIDSVFERWAPQTPMDIPTAVGFCMFISRQCLDAVGLFDEETFGRGYGEENDFCVRAEKAGFKNVLCPNLFVYHKGSMSFGENQSTLARENLIKLEKKHPSYLVRVRDFIKEDPIRPIRQVVMSGIQVCQPMDERIGVLYILHNYGGGTERHVEDLLRVKEQSIRAYILKPSINGYDFIDRNFNEPIIYKFKYDELTNHDQWLRKLLTTFKIQLIHVHHLIGYSNEFINSIIHSGVPYIFTVHDYYVACPRYNLLNDRFEYCQAETDVNICCDCLRKTDDSDMSLIDIALWRKVWGDFLRNAQLVITPTRSTAEILKRYYPEINFHTIEHGIGYFGELQRSVDYLQISSSHRNLLRVALLGAIGPHKGSRLLEELVEETRKRKLPIQWIVVGYTDLRPESYRSSDDTLVIHGEYKINEIPSLLKAYHVDVVFLPSVCPETYSYTLSEAWISGYPVIAPDLGAMGQRIRETGAGWILHDLKIDTVINTILELYEQPQKIQFAKEKIKELKLPNLNEVGSKYNQLYQKYKGNVDLCSVKPFTPDELLNLIKTDKKVLQRNITVLHKLGRRAKKFIRKMKVWS